MKWKRVNISSKWSDEICEGKIVLPFLSSVAFRSLKIPLF